MLPSARPRSVLSPPMLVALLALVIALGGTSYAAVTLAKNSVGARELKSNAVTSRDVKNGSLKGADFGAGQLPAGAPGAPGSPASAVITGRGSLTGTTQGVSLTGTFTTVSPGNASTLSPNTTTFLRNFSVKTGTPNGARNFFLWVDGITTTMCVVPATQLACTMTGVIEIPPSSRIAMTFTNVGEATTAEWGLTLSTS